MHLNVTFASILKLAWVSLMAVVILPHECFPMKQTQANAADFLVKITWSNQWAVIPNNDRLAELHKSAMVPCPVQSVSCFSFCHTWNYVILCWFFSTHDNYGQIVISALNDSVSTVHRIFISLTKINLSLRCCEVPSGLQNVSFDCLIAVLSDSQSQPETFGLSTFWSSIASQSALWNVCTK